MNSKIDEKSFVIKLKGILETNQEVELNTNLYQIEDYDSLAQMAIAAWITDDFKIPCKTDKIALMQTVRDILDYINSKE
jgi:acyl carrier protein